jgi:hypothetical protein
MLERIRILAAVTLMGASAVAGQAPSQPAEIMPLQLEAKIPLGDVRGRIDHMAIDLARQRLFVAELGNDSVSVVDLKDRKESATWLRPILSMLPMRATVPCACSGEKTMQTRRGSISGTTQTIFG